MLSRNFGPGPTMKRRNFIGASIAAPVVATLVKPTPEPESAMDIVKDQDGRLVFDDVPMLTMSGEGTVEDPYVLYLS